MWCAPSFRLSSYPPSPACGSTGHGRVLEARAQCGFCASSSCMPRPCALSCAGQPVYPTDKARPCSHAAPRPGISTRWRPATSAADLCATFDLRSYVRLHRFPYLQNPDADTGVCAVGCVQESSVLRHMWISCKAHGPDASWWAISSTGDPLCTIALGEFGGVVYSSSVDGRGGSAYVRSGYFIPGWDNAV
jgi:hypothetical protein